MPTPPLSEEKMQRAVDALKEHGSQNKAAEALGISRATLQHQLKKAALAGRAPGHFNSGVAPGYAMGKVTVQRDAGGNVVQTWERQSPDAAAMQEAMEAALAGFLDTVPHAVALPAPGYVVDELLTQYTITDVHLGALAWREETGNDDYDLSIASKLLEDWFAAAVDMAPNSGTAVLAQIGDLLHHDSHESVTPAHRHVLDADSRFQKMVRVAIRVLRRVIAMLLTKHRHVHIVMADANHDPASGAWLREMFSAFYEDEPRVTVDCSAGTYYAYRFGDVSLFFHHGHRRGTKRVDGVFAGRFREIYGATKHSYAHLGHRHSDELLTTNLMKVEQHETLAAPDAYSANGGYLSGRSAKVITYHKQWGEVGRLTLTPAMVSGFAAANDNVPQAERRAA